MTSAGWKSVTASKIVRSRWLLGACLCGLGLGLMTTAEPRSVAAKAVPKSIKLGKLLSKELVFSRVAPATVLIVIPTSNGFNIGSGVVVDPSGLIVTNSHVVATSPGTVQVFMFNPKERSLETNLGAYVKSHTPLIGRVIKRGEKDLDLALVRLPVLANNYPSVEMGDSDGLRIGQDVVAIGQPQGLTWTFTSGTVSAIRTDAIQTETPINPGNSGGPLLDMRGRLVAINTAIRRESQGLGFAIPVNTVRTFVQKYSNSQESDVPATPSGPRLSKNPVPLASLSLSQDFDKLRNLNGRRVNKQVEGQLLRDLEAAEGLRQRMIKGELTVAQMLPAMVEQIQSMAQHNQSGNDDSGEARLAFQKQLDRTVEHLKQIFQVSQ